MLSMSTAAAVFTSLSTLQTRRIPGPEPLIRIVINGSALDIISPGPLHLYGAGPACLLTPRSAAAPLQWYCRLELVCAASVAQCTASCGGVADGAPGTASVGLRSWCSLRHRVSSMLALWSHRYWPTSLSFGGRRDACPYVPHSYANLL